jgi:hypothetical protein
MSTAYYPKPKGHTERVNQTIEALLQALINLEIGDWAERLTMAEFAYNSSSTTAMGHMHIYGNYGYHPNTGTYQPRMDTLPVAVKAYQHWMMAINNDCHDSLEKIRKTMKI